MTRTKLTDPLKPRKRMKDAKGMPYNTMDEFHYHRTMPLTKMLKLNDKPKKKKLKESDVFVGGGSKKLEPICRPAPLQKQVLRAYQYYN